MKKRMKPVKAWARVEYDDEGRGTLEEGMNGPILWRARDDALCGHQKRGVTCAFHRAVHVEIREITPVATRRRGRKQP